MPSDSTRWTVIQRAAEGSEAAQAEFVRRYSSIIRAYFGARWRGTPLRSELDDATQRVFLDCFKDRGVLERADPAKGSGFRAFLYGVVRNVARDMERKRARSRERHAADLVDLDRLQAEEASFAKVFDRAWAESVLRDAAALHREQANRKGPEAVRRHELLDLRYGAGLPIREIAERWQVEAEWLHGQHRTARQEFKRALMDVVRDLGGGARESVEQECERLLTHFS